MRRTGIALSEPVVRSATTLERLATAARLNCDLSGSDVEEIAMDPVLEVPPTIGRTAAPGAALPKQRRLRRKASTGDAPSTTEHVGVPASGNVEGGDAVVVVADSSSRGTGLDEECEHGMPVCSGEATAAALPWSRRLRSAREPMATRARIGAGDTPSNASRARRGGER